MSPLTRLARLLKIKEKDAWDFYMTVKKEFIANPPKIPMEMSNEVCRIAGQVNSSRGV